MAARDANFFQYLSDFFSLVHDGSPEELATYLEMSSRGDPTLEMLYDIRLSASPMSRRQVQDLVPCISISLLWVLLFNFLYIILISLMTWYHALHTKPLDLHKHLGFSHQVRMCIYERSCGCHSAYYIV